MAERDFFSNRVAVSTSLYESLLAFLLISPVAFPKDADEDDEDEIEVAANVEDMVRVRMSPQHAKALAAILVSQIVHYEKLHGIELPTNPETAALWKRIRVEDEEQMES